MEAADLTVDLVHQRERHAVVDDRVEADFGQRVAQLGRGAVERPGISRETGPKSDYRDGASMGHGSAGIQGRNGFQCQNRAFQRIEQRQIGVAALARDRSSPDQAAPWVM
jgi:hypothetical protein